MRKEGEKNTCKHCLKDDDDEDHYLKLYPEVRENNFNNKGKQNTISTAR